MRLGRGAQSLVLVVMVVSMALLACKKKSSSTTSAGPSLAPAPAPTPTLAPLPATPTKTFGLNDAAVLDGVTLTVEEFKDCRLDNFYSRRAVTRKKEKLVGANVTFEGNGDKDHNISYTNFKVVDPEGMTYRSTFRSGSNCSPTLNAGRVAKGEKTKGWVIFQVPEKAKGFKVVFSNRRPFRIGTPAGEQEQKVDINPGG